MASRRKTAPPPKPKLPELLPWQQPEWSRLQRMLSSGRMPHALLLTGPEGVGKRQFAEVLATSLLCQDKDQNGLYCGHCRGCDLVLAETHSDLTRIEPEEPGKQIRIDTIRDYIAGEALTSQAGGYKVVIIDPADAMNNAAANSLLKTLEEPVDWTLILLVCSRPASLPATIRSRCQQLVMGRPDTEVASSWIKGSSSDKADPALLLALAAGAPLRARSLADPELLALRVKLLEQFAAIVDRSQDPVTVAAVWNKLELPRTLNWLSGWLADCLRLQVDAEFTDLFNPDQRKRLQGIAESIESKRLFKLLDAANRAIGSQDSQLNSQMVLESLLLSVHDDSEALG